MRSRRCLTWKQCVAYRPNVIRPRRRACWARSMTRCLAPVAPILCHCVATASLYAGAVFCATTSSASASALQPPATAASSASLPVWSGVYTNDQAKRGEAVASKSCTKCHDPGLSGGQDGPSLVGPEALQAWSPMTLGDLFDRIRTTMPADAPHSLSSQETVDVVAYVLSLNTCPGGEQELRPDAEALSRIRITREREPK